MKGSRFLGGRADILQNRFLAQRASLLNYHLLVVGFANQLQQVATLFEKADAQADASIGMPSGQTDRKTVPEGAPRNMQDLAKAVTDLYKTGTPIRVVEIGNNEYLVLVTGTKSGQVANNWNSAIRSGLGLPNDYQDQLKGILMGLPPGAVINLVGHSQGGIVSNNIAIDSEVNHHLTIKSVTTFGSPVSATPNNDVDYRRYAVLGDPVPLLGIKGVENIWIRLIIHSNGVP